MRLAEKRFDALLLPVQIPRLSVHASCATEREEPAAFHSSSSLSTRSALLAANPTVRFDDHSEIGWSEVCVWQSLAALTAQKVDSGPVLNGDSMNFREKL